MSSFVNNLDLIVILILLILIEYKRMNTNFIVFSPITVLCISIIYVYIMPIMIYGQQGSNNYISRLSSEQYSALVLYVRLFVYFFFIFSVIMFNRLPRKIEKIRKGNNQEVMEDPLLVFATNGANVSIMCLILIAIFFFIQFWMCDFNVSTTILKLIHPRDYIMREGYGTFNDLMGCIRFLLLFLTSICIYQKKSAKNILLYGLAIFINMIGGGKSSALRVCIITYLIFHRMNKNPKKIKLSTILAVSSIFFILILFSFGTMRSSGEGRLKNISDIINFIVEYDQEAYYSGRVISDFSPKIEYWVFNLESFVCTPIPRAIWSEKGYYSFYNGYWRAIYQPNTIMSHTSTYGILAEGQMLFGTFTPFIYALLLVCISKKIYKLYYDNNPTKMYLGIMLIVELYYIVRAGLFEPSTLWTLIIYTIFVSLMTKLFNVFSNPSEVKRRITFSKK